MKEPIEPTKTIEDGESSWISRRSFLWAGLAVAATYGGFRYLDKRADENGLGWPFRRALAVDEDVAKDYFANTSLAEEFKATEAKWPIDNGDEGRSDYDPETWHVKVLGTGDDIAPKVKLDEFRKLPAHEMTTELRCIEGWSVVVNWKGCLLSDFLKKYPPAPVSSKDPDPTDLSTLPDYVAIESSNGGYYVGLDMASAMHPQTILAYEMNGAPLKPEHGEPLRLVIPTKYGIKNIKWIGVINYTMKRPKDYWAEQGYDYYAGL